MIQSIGRWWVLVRLRNHIRRNARQWAFLSTCAVVWIGLVIGVKLLSSASDHKIKVLHVAGRVLLDGQPLSGGFVKFHPDASKSQTFGKEKPPSSQDSQSQFVPAGEIDANGNYELHTGHQKGAPPGWYRVVIVPAAATDDSAKGANKDSKPPFNVKFTRDDSTTLLVEVKENGEYTLELTK